MAHAPPLSPKISDVELLSIICQLGRAATEASMRHAIDERIGRNVSVEWARIAEIERAGLATPYHHHRGGPCLRLTAIGVERLSGVDHPTERSPK